MHTLPGEVGVVLVDQIFLDPEIIVAGGKEHNLLMWGVVTIPKAKSAIFIYMLHRKL